MSRGLMNKIYLSGAEASTSIEARLSKLITSSHPFATGMATAFLSIGGARSYDKLVSGIEVKVSRVVAGLSGAITHPAAIRYLIEKGHAVRFGGFSSGIFHPKLLVGGKRFLGSGEMVLPTCAYVGSANFTDAGLSRNLEVMLATQDCKVATGVAEAFCAIWTNATSVTGQRLEAYERAFARAQCKRAVSDLEFLDIVGSAPLTASQPILVSPKFCNAVWAGLQSFTGEHMFQVEFPRKAGEALGALLGTASGEVHIECADGQARSMTFRYYADNSMYRLNVPNSMPLVDWARSNHKGALLVWRDDDAHEGAINAEIIRGRRLNESVARSHALGSWGKTSTREYGWY